MFDNTPDNTYAEELSVLREKMGICSKGLVDALTEMAKQMEETCKTFSVFEEIEYDK
jgi:hypothetical protein